MERGANTFPFHNLLPYSESNEGLFLFFSPSLNWIKEKSVATLAIRNIYDKKQNKKSQSQFTVLQCHLEKLSTLLGNESYVRLKNVACIGESSEMGLRFHPERLMLGNKPYARLCRYS